jgi:hypothetical protein
VALVENDALLLGCRLGAVLRILTAINHSDTAHYDEIALELLLRKGYNLGL